MTVSSKRPEHVAWTSLILSVVFFAVAFFIGRWSGFFAVATLSWTTLSAVLIWLVLAIQFHQRALAEQEKLDMTQLAKDEHSATIFQGKGEQAAMFAAARRRLEMLEKWFIPIFAAFIALYEIAVGLLLVKAIPAGSEFTKSPPFLLCAVCMTAVAFVSFLISRYATGMSAEIRWKPLRAGGSFLLSIAVLCFALAIALALANFQIFVVLNVLNYVIPTLLVVLGIETALNIVLDVYRPRLKGQYSRAAFDSRLLGIINEPGGIFRSAAGAIDYQFGFKVSQTWFYKLLEKAIVPLLLFAAATLYLLSCLVIVRPDEEAIVEHFGNPLNSAGQVRLIGPGLAFKWPWPIDKARSFATQKISEMHIGYVPKSDPKTGEMLREAHLLWGTDHYEEEYPFLVATEHAGPRVPEGAVPVSLINAAVPVQYRVKDLYAYMYNYDDPAELLEAICYRELTKFTASATIDVNDRESNVAGPQASLFGAGREYAKNVLTSRIQKAVDEARLGIEIVLLGLQGIHPPVDVATDYQAVAGAVQEKRKLILEAEGDRNKDLSSLAGSVQDADELYDLATKYRQAGDISIRLMESQSYAFGKVTLARATGLRFADQLKAYRAARGIYKREQKLRIYEEALQNTRKYVIVADPNDNLISIINFQEKLAPDLYDGQENSPK